MQLIYVNNEMILQLSGDGKLTDEKGNPVTEATVEATLYEEDGETEVNGETWPVTLSERDNGEYSVTLSDEIEVKHGKWYICILKAEKDDINAEWRISVKAMYRT